MKKIVCFRMNRIKRVFVSAVVAGAFAAVAAP